MASVGHGPEKLEKRDLTPEALVAAEGIENAVSGSLIFPGVRAGAYLSHGNLPRVALVANRMTVTSGKPLGWSDTTDSCLVSLLPGVRQAFICCGDLREHGVCACWGL
jgi:hypothetical protein